MVLSVILTIVPRQHVLKLNKHGNVNKSPPKNIYVLIAGVENNYSFGKSEHPWAHESNGWWAHKLFSLRECSSNFYEKNIFLIFTKSVIHLVHLWEYLTIYLGLRYVISKGSFRFLNQPLHEIALVSSPSIEVGKASIPAWTGSIIISYPTIKSWGFGNSLLTCISVNNKWSHEKDIHTIHIQCMLIY